MKTKTTILMIAMAIILFSCGKNSSPDGRAQLRDADLLQKIDLLNQKQTVILDSLQVLDNKIKALTPAK